LLSDDTRLQRFVFINFNCKIQKCSYYYCKVKEFPHPRPLSHRERGESVTPNLSPAGRGKKTLTPNPSPKGRGEKALTPNPSPAGRGEFDSLSIRERARVRDKGKGIERRRAGSSPNHQRLSQRARGENPNPQPLSQRARGENPHPQPPLSSTKGEVRDEDKFMIQSAGDGQGLMMPGL